MERDRRHAARDRFFVAWVAGFPLGGLMGAVDAPAAVRIPVVVAWGAVVAAAGLHWVVLAARDGSIARDAPDYLWAAFALAVIALACAGAASVGLLLVGEEVTAERVTGWALIGTVAVIVTYWIRRAWRPPPARTRRR